MLFNILSRSGGVLYEGEFESLKLCVEAAVKASADLTRANLVGAYLADAGLAGANLAGAYLADAGLAGANLVGAYLARANLAGANLAGADLTDANLAGANLAGANLAGAYLAGADLAGANLVGAKTDPASPEEIARLDEVREIVLAQPKRLRMANWHSAEWDSSHIPEEERSCGSAHCIGGWLQALSPDPKVRGVQAATAGALLAPTQAHIFYATDAVALQWLTNRDYAR